MLVLSRRLQEKVVLPGLGVTIQVLAIKGGVVRLGIEAPMDVPIFRAELLNRSEPSPASLDAEVASEGPVISVPASDS